MQYLDLEENPAYQLWLATNAWQRMIRKALDPLDLTHVQFVILSSITLLTSEEQGPTQIDVSRFADLDVNMTSQVLKGLEQRGLVVRGKHPDDGRAHVLALTADGARVQADAKSLVRPASEAFFKPIEDRKQLAGLLRALHQDRKG
jgi:DNA-binding MarR family transcriptional regulator